MGILWNEEAKTIEWNSTDGKIAYGPGCCCEPREPCEFPVPLYGAISSKTGYAVDFPDSIEFNTDIVGKWNWMSGLNCGFGENNLSLDCSGSNAFMLQSGAGNICSFMGHSPDPFPVPSFSPLMLTFTVSGTFGCGEMSYVLTVTE